LFLVETGDEGFTRGRNLDKIGLHGNDTSELFFDEVPLPADRLLGAENGGFTNDEAAGSRHQAQNPWWRQKVEREARDVSGSTPSEQVRVLYGNDIRLVIKSADEPAPRRRIVDARFTQELVSVADFEHARPGQLVLKTGGNPGAILIRQTRRAMAI
ncbi:MAG: hypothetical protein V4637_04595, partial [Pseudomonadota bacterium]